MEISGNRKVRERLNELGVNKISGIFDYSSDGIQKLKSELGEKVIEILKIELGSSSNVSALNSNTNSNNSTNVKQSNNNDSSSTSNSKKIKKIEEVTFDDVKVETPKSEVKEATKFKNFENNNLNVKITSASNDNKGRKINKIQKVDFDFDFDNFGDTNFSSMNLKGEEGDKNKKFDDEKFELEKETKKNSFKNDDEEEERYYKKPKVTQDEINKKFANKKAISSDDYQRLEENPSEKNYYKSKINSMKNYQAISSSDVFGETEDGKKYLIIIV
jgi:hypothetical protein